MLYQNSPLHNILQSTQGNQQSIPVTRKIPVPIEQTLPQAINYCADFSGCGIWRMVWPQYVLNACQKAVVHSSTTMILDERFYSSISCVRIQRQATPQQKKFVQFLKQISQKNGMRIVYEIDDIVFREDIPDYNKFKEAFVSDEIRNSSQEIMMLCDEITVTCPFMKQYFADKTGHTSITVIPNYPPKFWLGNKFNLYKIQKNWKKHCRGRNPKPRILYAGSGAHFDIANRNNQEDDFTHVLPAIVHTIDKYQWVFIGAVPQALQQYIQQGKIEFHPWQQILQLPEFISNLEINCIIAPLQDNTFNRAKSDIKFIEGCAHGLPVICQDIVTYENTHIKFNTSNDLLEKINYVVSSQNRYVDICREANNAIQDRWLEDNIDAYIELYTLPYGHKNRIKLNQLNEL